ncbi:cytochrome-c peroxidase [Roseibacillus ishigakijimensis]|uniref:C-type cytochrome n=1 Tax=Roseibacillus ishigakijimensis TaxID=454146 RepID=A0A934RUN5_9BACT|nr:cytochrome c peroxidase [Roseibacillus ishigakijimensis]MBK1834480.1 c-type cytochrome [Roseibacillus ishigakijimensis]
MKFFPLFLPLALAADQSAPSAGNLLLDHPPEVPAPELPRDYPLSAARIALGQRLFFDDALASKKEVSCAFCHLPQEAFSDPSLQPWGVQPAHTTRRHSMPLFNLAWKKGPFRWDGEEPTLRGQMLRPIVDPIEMGENLATLPAKLAAREGYLAQFQAAFGDQEITPERLAIALEQYVLTLTSFDSRYDQAQRGGDELTALEKRGESLFFTSPTEGGAGCARCHPAPFFTDHGFHNNGLPLRKSDHGREEVTGEARDRGKFATPSLRNIAVTASYMHDGRFATLAEVVAHYATAKEESPSLPKDLRELRLDQEEQAVLVAFLETLSDPQFAEPSEPDPREVDPFDY